MRRLWLIPVVLVIAVAVMGQTYQVRRWHVEDLDWGIGTRAVTGRLAATVTGHKMSPINVLAFGVTGNGTTDDTDSLQAVIDLVEAAGLGGTIYVPAGTYRVTSTLTIRPTATTWVSDNIVFDFTEATIVADTTLNGPVIKIGDSSGNTNHVTIRGGIINYAGSARNYDPETTGITLERAYNCEIDGLTVVGAYKGVELIASNGGCVYNRVRVDKLWDCCFGLYLENTGTGWVNDNTFDGGSIYYSSSVAAIDLHAAAAVYAKKDAAATYAMVANKFLNMSLEANDAAIPDAYLAKAMLLKAWDTNVFGCRFEGFDGSADTVQFIILDSGTWGYHFVGGTELWPSVINRPNIVATLHTERTHRLVGSADYLPAGGPILHLNGNGGYGSGYPMMSVVRAGTDTCLVVNGAGINTKNVTTDSVREQTVANGVYIDGARIKDGTLIRKYGTFNATDTLAVSDDIVAVTSIAANITIYLPSATTVGVGKTFTIIKTDATDTVFVVPVSGVNYYGPAGSDTLVTQYDRWSGVSATSLITMFLGGRSRGAAY